MTQFLRDLWATIRSNGESLGYIFISLGVLTLLVQLYLIIIDAQSSNDLFGIWLGLFSVGLGSIAIGMAAKSDKRYTELLEKLNKNVALLPTLFKNDVLTLPGQQVVKDVISEQNKEAAQKRLDDDTHKVGHVRGEIYQLEDGKWGIHWGGKYPL